MRLDDPTIYKKGAPFALALTKSEIPLNRFYGLDYLNDLEGYFEDRASHLLVVNEALKLYPDLPQPEENKQWLEAAYEELQDTKERLERN
jgi:hypothetical protein